MDQASRLLVIGDDPQWVHTLSNILSSAGYEVSNAQAGSEALDQAMEQAPDLVLLGTPSSGAGNFQQARRLKSGVHHPFCLLLLFDASPTPPDLARALETGADDWLVWPASDRQLLSRVQTILRLHHATLALKKSEERFRALFQYASDLVSIVDGRGTLTYASPSHEWLLGYPQEQLVGHNMIDFVHPDDLSQVQASLARLLRQPDIPVTATFRFRHHDGTWCWLESAGRNQIDNPAIGGIVANSHDITARVLAEEKLRESETRFKAQYKGLPIPVYTWQKMEDDFVLVDFNHAAHQITRGNVTQLLGARASQLYADEPGIVREMWHCYTAQRAFRREMLYHFRSIDDTRHLSVSYGFVPPDTVLVHTQDVTERVQAMDDLQQLRDELEQRVRRRTAELNRANQSLRAEVDERRLVEHALRDSEQRYRLLAENATDMISRHTPEGIYLYASPMAHPLLGYEPHELVGRSAYDFFHPDDLASIRQSHETILKQPIIYSISYRMRRKDGRYVWVETNSKTVRHPDTGQITEIVAITRDITDRKQVEDALRRSQQQLQSLYTRLEQHSRTLEEQVSARTREIEQRRQVAESLRDMLTILNSDLPLDEVLDYIVAGATRLLGSDTSAIYRLESPDEPLRIQTVQGSAAEVVGQIEFPPQFHQALRQGQPIAVTDVAVMPPDAPLALALGFVPDCFRGLLVVPLSAQDQFFGGLALYYARPRNLSDEEMGLAMAFAAQAALAIQNAHLRHQVREVAVMEERARLARELHDSVTQSLFSMNLLAEAGQRLAKSGDVARLEAYLQRLGEMSHQSLKEMRLLVHELRPLALEKHGLLGALQRRLDAVEARAGVDARLLVEGTIQVPPPAEEHLYRIAEQALNNALKHAAAQALTLRLAAGDGQLVMEIVDDGRGFDPEVAGDGAGHGLISMGERAAQIGAALTITSAPGQGTTIAVRLPTGAVPENHEVKQ